MPLKIIPLEERTALGTIMSDIRSPKECDEYLMMLREKRDDISLQLQTDAEEFFSTNIDGDPDWRHRARTALRFTEREMKTLKAWKVVLIDKRNSEARAERVRIAELEALTSNKE